MLCMDLRHSETIDSRARRAQGQMDWMANELRPLPHSVLHATSSYIASRRCSNSPAPALSTRFYATTSRPSVGRRLPRVNGHFVARSRLVPTATTATLRRDLHVPLCARQAQKRTQQSISWTYPMFPMETQARLADKFREFGRESRVRVMANRRRMLGRTSCSSSLDLNTTIVPPS